MRRILLIFAIAFILNVVWENFHSFLYDNYKGGEITELILLRAALFDALIILFMALPFFVFSFLQDKFLAVIIVGFVLAVFIEWWALDTNRWSYNIYMPIIPFLSVGLTPAIQLGLLGYFSIKIQKFL
ncbi:MAG: hypothetical protein WC797_00970 [Candidatus Paceibacterota bacterium]|jgi:hypothetical protein